MAFTSEHIFFNEFSDLLDPVPNQGAEYTGANQDLSAGMPQRPAMNLSGPAYGAGGPFLVGGMSQLELRPTGRNIPRANTQAAGSGVAYGGFGQQPIGGSLQVPRKPSEWEAVLARLPAPGPLAQAPSDADWDRLVAMDQSLARTVLPVDPVDGYDGFCQQISRGTRQNPPAHAVADDSLLEGGVDLLPDEDDATFRLPSNPATLAVPLPHLAPGPLPGPPPAGTPPAPARRRKAAVPRPDAAGPTGVVKGNRVGQMIGRPQALKSHMSTCNVTGTHADDKNFTCGPACALYHFYMVTRNDPPAWAKEQELVSLKADGGAGPQIEVKKCFVWKHANKPKRTKK